MNRISAPARFRAASRTAAELLDRTTVRLIGIAPAREVTPQVTRRRFLHAGPPLHLSELPGPMRGAVLCGLLFEGEARDIQQATAILDRGEVELAPCQDAGGAGAVAGVVTPGMPVVVVEADGGGTSFSPLNEGTGRALRFGAHDQQTLARLAWLRDVLAPILDRAIRRTKVEITELQEEGLRRGDECHNRTVATSTTLLLRLVPALLRSASELDDLDAVLRFAHQNPHFFVPFSMAAAKALADRAHDIPDCPVVTGMGANGVRVAVRVSGTGDRWFTAPAPMARPRLFPGFRLADVQPVMGDSLIIEAVGLGACALSAAPAICSYIGGTPAETSEVVARMRQITATTSTRFLIPYEGFRGTPLGIDVMRVSSAKIAPVSNTGLAHRRPGIGQVGAGLAWLPLPPFEAAARALSEEDRDAG